MVELLGVTMRRYRVYLSIFIVLAVTLVAPSLALAQTTFQIKDAHGRVCGSFSHPKGQFVVWKVAKTSGVRVGTLLVNLPSDAYKASSAFHTPGEPDVAPAAWAVGKVLYTSQPYGHPDAIIGKAVPAQGRWLLKRRRGTRYVTVGSTQRTPGCTPETALCAARLLLWPRDASLSTWQVHTVGGTYRGTIWGAQNVTYGNNGITNTGMGATIWYQGAGAPSFWGQVGHDMTENGPVASMWGVWDASWQEQGVRIERVSDDLFTVTRLSDMTTTERLVRSSTGPWRLQWLDAAGQWNTFETIPRGCPGGLAAGAAMFLGSMGDV